MKRRCPDCNGDADASTKNTLSHDVTCWIGQGLESATDSDIEWFQAFPKEDFRIRKAIKAELITMNLNEPATIKVYARHNRCCTIMYAYTKSRIIAVNTSYCKDITEKARLADFQYISRILAEDCTHE